jgi:hypothetical protein
MKAKSLLSRLIGASAEPSKPDTQTPSSLPAGVSPAPATAQELVRMAMRAVRRRAGIPSDWVSTEVVALDRAYASRLEVQIVVRHWDERLLAYAKAIEKALREEIERLDPAVAGTVRHVTWRFSRRVRAPHEALPPPDFPWLDPTPQRISTRDLIDELVARGELAPSRPAARPAPQPDPHGFAPTQQLAGATDHGFAPTQPAERGPR